MNSTIGNKLAIDSPNLVKITSQADSVEIVKLLKLIIIIAVTCEKHEVFIGRIQKLDAVLQTTLMHIIGPALDVAPIEQTQEGREIVLEERLAKVLAEREELRDIQAGLEATVEALKEEMGKHGLRAKELEREPSTDSADKRIDEFKEYIAELEAKLSRQDDELRDRDLTIKQMSETIEGNKESTKELEDLKRQLKETEQEVARLSKIESVAKKYKARLQEQKDLERRMESLENQNFELKSSSSIGDEMPGNSHVLSDELEGTTGCTDRLENDSKPNQTVEELHQQIRDLELERDLVASAWYSLASRIQQQNVLVMKKAYESPKGWITKQRQAMDRIP